jgi:hypothetical protein
MLYGLINQSVCYHLIEISTVRYVHDSIKFRRLFRRLARQTHGRFQLGRRSLTLSYKIKSIFDCKRHSQPLHAVAIPSVLLAIDLICQSFSFSSTVSRFGRFHDVERVNGFGRFHDVERVNG